jgi:hypothetical protein
LSEQSFISDVLNAARDNKISVKLLHRRSHKGCGGFFDEKNLVCCTDMPKQRWLSILSHESCHMDQFLEGEPLYLNVDLPQIQKNRQKRYRAVMEMERDCEERSIRKIIHYGLPIYLEPYYRAGNCYLASHYYFAKYNCFYKVGRSPYDDEELMSLFPDDRFLSPDELWKPNKKLGAFLKKWNTPQ